MFDGLDVRAEVAAVARQQLGDTLLLQTEGGALRAFAVCHQGLGSEAGSRDCSVKFGAAVDAATFGELLDAITAFGAMAGAELGVIAINAACELA